MLNIRNKKFPLHLIQIKRTGDVGKTANETI